ELFKSLLKLDIAAPGFRTQIAGYDIRLSQILLTALARYALDGRLAIEPIEAQRLEEARAAVMTTGTRPARLSEGFKQRVGEALRARLDEAARRRSADFVK